MSASPHTPPTVRAVWTSTRTAWRINCPHCFAVHVHGAQAGHKAAHCEPGTPGKTLGYVIEAPSPVVK